MQEALIATLLALLIPQVSAASDEELTVNFGVGAFDSAKGSPAETKILAIGYNRLIYDRRLFYRFELGGYADSAGNGRKSSFFGGSAFGLNVENSLFYAQGSGGAVFITTPDAYLGGNFQFTEEVNLGLNGFGGSKLGVFYKHISSAGIYDPNIGRDFFGVKLIIPVGQ